MRNRDRFKCSLNKRLSPTLCVFTLTFPQRILNALHVLNTAKNDDQNKMMRKRTNKLDRNVDERIKKIFILMLSAQYIDFDVLFGQHL